MTREPLPVVPAAHYHCGGIQVNLRGETKITGLYAAGEVSCTGLHGANRLASTSLLEGLVWGVSIADAVANEPLKKVPVVRDMTPARAWNHTGTKTLCLDWWKQNNEILKHVMWEQVGPVRTSAQLEKAVKTLGALKDRVESMYHQCAVTPQSLDLRNAVSTAYEIAIAAKQDPTSIGTHYRVPMEEEATAKAPIAMEV